MNDTMRAFGMVLFLAMPLAAIAFVQDIYYLHCMLGGLWGFIVGGLIRSIAETEEDWYRPTKR